MEETSSSESSWSLSTTRVLYSTLPFDTREAILFLPERCTARGDESSGDSGTEDSAGLPGKITGNEARQFYEEILSMPEQSAHVESGNKDSKSKRPKQWKHLHKKRQHKEIISNQREGDSLTSPSRLFWFAQEGDVASLRSALSKGLYDINMVDAFGWTLLMCAAHAGHMDVVRYLMCEGAQWREPVDRRGNTAAALARIAGHFHIAEIIESFRLHGHIESESCSSLTRKRRRGTGVSSLQPERKRSTFYCEVCKLNVMDSEDHRHMTSTVHQFSSQHKPNISTYGIPNSNRGYQILLKGGWNPEKGLGSKQQGQKYPVKTILKQDRLGFGIPACAAGKPRVTHFSAYDEDAVKSLSERAKSVSSVPVQRKKEIVRTAEKERRWEMRMRRYMNSDY